MRDELLVAKIAELQQRLEVARPVVRAADRYCRCLAEFNDPRYCSEWLEALDKALLDYAVYEGQSK